MNEKIEDMPTRFVRLLAKEKKIKNWETESISRLRCKLEDLEDLQDEEAEDTFRTRT